MTPTFVTSLQNRWRAASLSMQFAVTAAAVIGCGMAMLGWFVVGRIEKGVVAQSAASAALHMDIFIEPQLQDLRNGNTLSLSAQEALRNLRTAPQRGHSVAAVNVWGKDGELIFSTQDIVGLHATPDHAKLIANAWSGNVQSDYAASTLQSVRGGGPMTSDPVLKVFAPMHARDTGDVFAVAELNAISPDLANSLMRTRVQTSAVVGLLSLAMVASLFGIVRSGSRVIGDQREALEGRVRELTTLLSENASLQTRIVDMTRRATDNNDKAMRRIGAELHDGPVQLVALALLQLETLRLPGTDQQTGRNFDDFDAIEAALREALKEIRDLCSGLSLPNLERAPVTKVIEYAIMNHERRTRSSVIRDIDTGLPPTAPPLALTCVYRFVQEGLNNAQRHAGGKGQKISALLEGDRLRISVSDQGPGISAENLDPSRFQLGHGLGIAGLKDRVESLGGTFTIVNGQPCGTTVTAELPLHTNNEPFPQNIGILNS
jgi:signal transduction histidine kinase